MSDDLWPDGVPTSDTPDAAPVEQSQPTSPTRPAPVEDPLADYTPPGEPLPGPEPDASPKRARTGSSTTKRPTRSAAANTRPTARVPEGVQDADKHVLPVEAAAEVSILAALLSTPDTFDDVSDRLTPEDFGVPAHAAIYRAIVNCDATGRPLDPISVADELKLAGALDSVGGLETLTTLSRRNSTTVSLADHVGIIADRSLRRRLVGAARTIGSTALAADTHATDALAAAEAAVFELGNKRNDSSNAEMPLVVANVFEHMGKARNAKLLGHSTGFAKLDDLTGGWLGGQLIIVAGRPGMGKSILALQWARLIAELSDTLVPFLSFEMSQTELGLRMLSASTGIDLQLLMRGQIPDGMDRVVAHEAEKMSQLRLLVNDAPPRTISGVRSMARRLARRGPLGAIVVDYLQLMEGEGRRRDETRTQEISDLSRGLKALASELNVPVFACSQLNRGVEQRPNRRPVLSDLRESGSIEQDASIVIAAYRDYVYDKTASETDGELIILKHRNGRAGDTIPVDFEGRCVRYKDTDRQIAAPAPRAAGAPAAAAAGGFAGGARAGSWSSSDPF